MANVPIWPGSSSFDPGGTQFGFYDYDAEFRADADKVSVFCARRLGYPLVDVELQSGSFYTAFEEAVTTYGNELYSSLASQQFSNIAGAAGGQAINKTLLKPTLNRTIQTADQYGMEAEVGGTTTIYTGSLPVTASKQNYDLDAWAVQNNITGSSGASDIEIRRIFYEAPPAILRYFDPYAGTGTGIQSLMDAFDFGCYSPGVNFLLMPASYDVLKIQAIEFNDQIRRSSYSFEIINNKLKLFPIPTVSGGSIRFDYIKLSDKKNVSPNDTGGLVTNIADVPYSNPTYANINSVGRQWVFRYTLALARELLGYIRGKYTTVPVPGSEATLNQADLLADARTEKEGLITNLREMLDQTSRQAQLERKASETENLNKVLSGVPYTIYIG